MKRILSKSEQKRICKQTDCYYRDHLKEQIVILEAEIKRLRADIQKALDDDDNWGPDVTVRGYLEEALGNENTN